MKEEKLIRVAKDGVTVLDEPNKPTFYDEWKRELDNGIEHDFDKQVMLGYQDRVKQYQQAEQITLTEHNKRLIAEIERLKEVAIFDQETQNEQIKLIDQANETINKQKEETLKSIEDKIDSIDDTHNNTIYNSGRIDGMRMVKDLILSQQ